MLEFSFDLFAYNFTLIARNGKVNIVADIFPIELAKKRYDALGRSFFYNSLRIASYITKLMIGLITKTKFGRTPLKNA